MIAYVSKTLSSLIINTGINCNCSNQSFSVLDNWSIVDFWARRRSVQVCTPTQILFNVIAEVFPVPQNVYGFNCILNSELFGDIFEFVDCYHFK